MSPCQKYVIVVIARRFLQAMSILELVINR